MKHLPNVTLVCADCVNHGQAIMAIKKTLEHITPHATYFFTDREFDIPGVYVFEVSIKSKRDYSTFILKNLYHYIDTEYVLIIQADGYVLDGEQWDDEYFKYDLIGAPWPYDHDRQVGNGGCSLRSTKLLRSVSLDSFIDVLHPEDQSISIIYKMYLEERHGIKFAPVELASKFSYELIEPTQKTFAFHGYHWPPYKETVVIKRTGAMGDVIQVEPLLYYFWKKGYKVVLDTLPEFYSLFAYQHYEITFKQYLNPSMPYKEYNLDMSYEVDPKKLHLKAYFDFCGIPEGEQLIRRPNLGYRAEGPTKLFKKYAVIHIDKREQESRNVRGIDWSKVMHALKIKGITPIQIGKNDHEDTGALFMSTVQIDLMAYLIAGCDIFIGSDSGPSHVAVATGRKCVIFFGSVDPHYIHPDMTRMLPMANRVCDTPFCWHDTIGTTGTKCYISNDEPPCATYSTEELIVKINGLL